MSWEIVAILLVVVLVASIMSKSTPQQEVAIDTLAAEPNSAPPEGPTEVAKPEAPAPQAGKQPSSLGGTGLMFIVVGMVIAGYSWMSDVSLYSDIANIDAVGQRGMMHEVGIGLFVAGVIMACTGHIIDELRGRP
jgi:hypothetical protein